MLYTVRILRGADDQFVENFKTACREKRFASPTHFLFVAFCFFLSPLSPILLPRPVVCSFIVRTYTPAAIGSADEMNTLALREADAESKVQSQRVSKTNKKRKCSISVALACHIALLLDCNGRWPVHCLVTRRLACFGVAWSVG